MTPNEYLKESARTAQTPMFLRPHGMVMTVDEAIEAQLSSELLHAAMGMVTEAGEFIDALKKMTIYGKTLDRTNLIEELGDQLWYIALACRALDVSLEDVMDINIRKLKVRFPDKFTSKNALERDLDAERQALEGK